MVALAQPAEWDAIHRERLTESGAASIERTTRLSILEGVKRATDNSRAWERFHQIYAPVIFRYARHARLQEHDASDVVAIVMRRFVMLMRRGWEYDPQRGRFSHYVKRVTNRVIAEIRGKQPRTVAHCELSQQPAAAEDDGCWERAERQERLRACIARMREKNLATERDLQAFDRFAVRDEDAESVAASLGISVNRLYGIKHEVIQKLRALNRGLSRVIGEA